MSAVILYSNKFYVDGERYFSARHFGCHFGAYLINISTNTNMKNVFNTLGDERKII